MGWRVLQRSIAAVALSAGSVLACRQIVGIGQDPPTGSSPAESGSPPAEAGSCGSLYSGACGACVQSSCCSEASACAASPSCAPFEKCVASCNGDPACRSACTISAPLPSDSTELAALAACIASSCAPACGVSCGGIDYYTPPGAARACQSCIAAGNDVCSAVSACGASADCQALAQCDLSCQARLDCRQACTRAHPVGAATNSGLVTTVNAQCADDCALGADFQCSGHVTTPFATQNLSSVVEVQILELGTSAPLAGVDVSYCNTGTESCSPAVPTDDAGLASLAVPLIADTPGPRGYVAITSRAPDAGGGVAVVPTLAYWGFPITQPQVTLALPPADAGGSVAYGVITVAEPSDQAILASLLGVTPDPSRGNIGVYVEDCLGLPARGVQVTCAPSDEETQRFYAKGTPTSLSFPPGLTQTDGSGTVVFTNVPSGDGGAGTTVSLVATVVGSSTPLATATVLVKPGQTTGVTMLPTQ